MPKAKAPKPSKSTVGWTSCGLRRWLSTASSLPVRERVTAEEVKCLLLGMAFGQETLLGYFRSYIEYFEKRVGVNRTAKSTHTYRCAREHVERFLSERLRLSDIPFSALDRSFIDRFDLYLRTERKLAPNTIVLYMSRLQYGNQQSYRRRHHLRRPVRRIRASASRTQTALSDQKGTETTDDYAAFCAEALPRPRLVFVLLLYGYQLRRYVPTDRRKPRNGRRRNGMDKGYAGENERGVRDTAARPVSPHHQ